MEKTKRLPMIRSALRESVFLVVPRSARDIEVRRYIDEYTCWPPVIFMPLITCLEVTKYSILNFTFKIFLSPF